MTFIDRDPFDEALDAAIAALPEPYRQELATVAIVVDDEPDAAQLAEVDARGLFGLYQGVPRTAYGADGAPFASKITLFRGPEMARQHMVRRCRHPLDHRGRNRGGRTAERPWDR